MAGPPIQLIGLAVKLNKEQRVYAAVLGVAVVGLAVDRLVLSSPLTGPAGAAAGEAPPDPIQPPAAQQARAAETPAPSDLAQRLEALRGQTEDAGGMADVLTIPPAWFEGESALQPADPAAAPPAPAKVYKLTALAAGRSRHDGFAVVNRERLAIGESIDGMKLVEVRGRQAIFEAKSGKIILTMDPPMKPGRE